jgi:hypothetical protein
MERPLPERPGDRSDQQGYVRELEKLVDELLGEIDMLWTELQVTRINAGLDPLGERPRHARRDPTEDGHG